ncbi:proton-conducting transporter membrane subunit [Roseibium salinum]|nr:proton-conducting transporter membrane subunit [Roseibium salinum]
MSPAVGNRKKLTFSGVWALDGASIWGRLIILGTTVCVVLLSPDWMKTDRRHGEYYAVLLFSCLGAMVLAAAADLLQLIMGALLSSVTGYTLAAYHRDWGDIGGSGTEIFPHRRAGQHRACRRSDAGLRHARKHGFPGTRHGLRDKRGLSPADGRHRADRCRVGLQDRSRAGACMDARCRRRGTGPPAAAFLTVAPKIGGAIALARFVALVPPETIPVRPAIAALAAATMTLGNLAALWQDDVRRLIGWSSVSQSGYALMAVCVLGLAPPAHCRRFSSFCSVMPRRTLPPSPSSFICAGGRSVRTIRGSPMSAPGACWCSSLRFCR